MPWGNALGTGRRPAAGRKEQEQYEKRVGVGMRERLSRH